MVAKKIIKTTTFCKYGTLTYLTSGPSVSWGTFTGALVRGAGGPVLTVTGQGAVGTPAALLAHTITVDTWKHTHKQVSYSINPVDHARSLRTLNGASA